MKLISLNGGIYSTKVDDDDYENLKSQKWYAGRARYTHYVIARSGKHMHRILMGDPEGFVIDHINGDGLDNRRCNLRITTPSENSKNRRDFRAKTPKCWQVSEHS